MSSKELTTSVQNDLIIAELLTKNYSLSKIKRYAAENLKLDNFEETYKAAQVIIFNQNNLSQVEYFSKQLAALDDLYEKNYKENDLKECREIIKTKTDIFLMYREFINMNF